MSVAAEFLEETVDSPVAHVDVATAMDEVHRLYYRRLVALCTPRVRDRGLAEDVAQETLFRAARAWSSFDQSRPAWPWLKVIATRLCLDSVRAKGNEYAVAELPETADLHSGELDGVLDRMVMHQALARLPERQRQALELRYLNGLERDDAAADMGMDVNAFDQLLWRARTKIAHELRDERIGGLVILLAPFRWLRDRLKAVKHGLSTSGAAMAVTLPLVAAGSFAVVAGSGVFSNGVADTSSLTKVTQQSFQSATAPKATPVKAHAPAARTRPAKPALELTAGHGPVQGHVKVQQTPLTAGRSEEHRFSVVTPMGTVSLGGDTNHDPGEGPVCKVTPQLCAP